MSRGPDWLPWRRDWSQYPNVWKIYLAYTVVFIVAAAYYLAAGSRFGIFWACLALATLVTTGYVYRRSRPGQPASDHNQPG